MAFVRERMTGLRIAKRLGQHELEGVAHSAVRQYETGHKTPGIDALEKIADALDTTVDYLLGRGDDYRGGEEGDNYALASAKMSFACFLRALEATPPTIGERARREQQAQRCRRVWEDDQLLKREGAPRTAEAWKSLAEMIDRAVPTPPRIGAARTG
jgi:transcriptional regulator with XRE-family HTH domain